MVVVSFLSATPEDRGNYIGTGVVLLGAFAITAAIVRHRTWPVRPSWRSSSMRPGAPGPCWMRASMAGRVEDGILRGVSEGFAGALGSPVGRLEDSPCPRSCRSPWSRGPAGRTRCPSSIRTGASLPERHSPELGGGGRSEVLAVRDQTHEQLHKANILFMDRMASIGTLASGVAHEVNNALTAPLGATELGRLAQGRGDADSLSSHFESIQQSSQRISECAQLQTFGSRAETRPTSSTSMSWCGPPWGWRATRCDTWPSWRRTSTPSCPTAWRSRAGWGRS